MQTMIKRPVDDYDPLWMLFNRQNPGLMRAVGADTDDGASDTDGDDTDKDKDSGKSDDKADGKVDTDATDADGEKKGGDDKDAVAKTEDWSASIENPDVLKHANRFASRADQAKAHFELERENSARIKVPGKDASEEDVAKFRKSLGVPEKSEEYVFDKPEHMSDEDFKADGLQNTLDGFKSALHVAGATTDVAAAAVNYYWELDAAAKKLIAENDAKAIEEAESALRKDWGKDYEQNVRFGDAFLEKQGAIELKQMELKDGTLLGSHPDFIKMTAVSGRRIGEGSLQVGLTGTEAGVDLQKESTRLANAVADANAAGDTELAEKLAVERRAVNEKLHGKDAA